MSETYIPNRGDIVWLIFEPRVGHEQSGRRPAIVLSERSLAEHTSLAIVCPITSRPKGLPHEIVLKDTVTTGAVLPIHIRSLDITIRKAKFIETAPPELVAKLQEYVAVIIGK